MLPRGKTVLVTGSREFTDQQTIWTALELAEPIIVIHGGARGADRIASHWCRRDRLVYEITIRPKWALLGKAAGPERNRIMLSLHPDIVLAFFKLGANNWGTRGTAQMAKDSNIPVEEFWA